jgi:hypothetical protein
LKSEHTSEILKENPIERENNKERDKLIKSRMKLYGHISSMSTSKILQRVLNMKPKANSQEEQYGQDFSNNKHSLIHKEYDKLSLICCIVPVTTACM